MKIRSLLAGVTLFSFVLVASTPPVLAGKKGSDSDVSMEVVGAVLNASPSASIQYGYLSLVNGLDNVFNGTPQNETTALLTFFSDTQTVRVINNGPLRIVNRVGTFTIFLDNAPNADFSNPDSFRDGTPVMTGSLRHQVVLNTTTNTFTTVFVITVISATPFRADGHGSWFGQPGQKFRLTVFGQASTSGPGQFVIAGYATGGNLILRD
jgi:hypothetical protein